MKDFVKMTLAVICGIFITSIVTFILSLGFIGSLAAAGSIQPTLPKSGILKLDMSKMVILEQGKPDDPFSKLQRGDIQSIGLLKAVKAINAAAEDPAIKCIYILPDNSSTGMATLQEFRKALENFRSSGKPIVAYTENTSTGGYYLASVADKIYMTSCEGGMAMMTGVSSQLIFLKDLLDKLGINMQLIRHGKYKSAGEMYIRNSASEENLRQTQELVDALWSSIAGEIARSRDISVEALDAAIDNLTLCTPEDFVKESLVDELVSREQLQDKLASLAVVEKFKDVKMISLNEYASAKVLPSKAKQKIAIIYADGEIVDGSHKQEVAGDRFASEIAKVRADSSVKAVVLRVNSPGGSVLASEKIKSELDLLKAEKMLVASYGGYAASGGYWISNNCEKIFSDATTITGSIGVFSMIPDFSKAAHDIAHVNITTVSSNRHGDMLGGFRPLDNDELAYMQRSVEVIYDKFTEIVSEGRGLDKDYVDEIGQGRVWAGSDALEIGLVDEIGTLEDAIHWTAVAAGESDLTKWEIAEYPAPTSAFEDILTMFGGMKDDDASVLFEQLRRSRKAVHLATLPYEIRLNF